MPEEAFKVIVSIPETYSEKMMDSVNEVMEPFYPGYDRTFSITKTIGTWRPLKGSHPFQGEIDKIETSEELKIEFIVKSKDLKKVLNTIVEVHPYEEPSIDVIPCFGWRSML